MRIPTHQSSFFSMLYILVITSVINSSSLYAEAGKNNRRNSNSRGRTRGVRDAFQVDKQASNVRACNESERKKAGCLAGACRAIDGSKVHTYVSCRCPLGRVGKRCEELEPNMKDITEMARALSELCKDMKIDITDNKGYEATFDDCLKHNVIKESRREQRRLAKKRERKLRRQRMRERKNKDHEQGLASLTIDSSLDTRGADSKIRGGNNKIRHNRKGKDTSNRDRLREKRKRLRQSVSTTTTTVPLNQT